MIGTSSIRLVGGPHDRVIVNLPTAQVWALDTLHLPHVPPLTATSYAPGPTHTPHMVRLGAHEDHRYRIRWTDVAGWLGHHEGWS